VNVFKNAFIKAFEGKLENENIEIPKVAEETLIAANLRQ
jgi:hypothetical protein